MKRAVLILSFLTLGGCASGPDKQAALDADETPVATQDAVTLPVARLEPAIEPAAAPQSQPETPTAQAAPPLPVATIPNNSTTANPIDVIGPVQASASESPWDDLTRRVTAWANPLRRSMEPYCQDGLVRKP